MSWTERNKLGRSWKWETLEMNIKQTPKPPSLFACLMADLVVGGIISQTLISHPPLQIISISFSLLTILI